jgi:hypothetical protein
MWLQLRNEIIVQLAFGPCTSLTLLHIGFNLQIIVFTAFLIMRGVLRFISNQLIILFISQYSMKVQPFTTKLCVLSLLFYHTTCFGLYAGHHQALSDKLQKS